MISNLNAYYCEECRGYIVTIDRDEGVTPMFLSCRVKGEPDAPGNDCKGRMRSMMYPPLEGTPWPIDPTPGWEWYMPDQAELVAMDRSSFEYHNKGGLALRKIDKEST